MGYPYDSTYLLDEFRRLIGRPQQADAVTQASYYNRLSEAQTQIVTDIAAVCPNVLYSTTASTLSTSDNKTFSFGTSLNGFALAPIGRVKVYRSLNDIPDSPMQPGFDYIALGGTSIQIPNDQRYTGTLYWRGIVPPGVIDGSGSHEPSLFPEGSRQLIAYRAAINFLLEGGRNPELAATYAGLYGRPLGPGAGMFSSWVQTWRTQFAGGGALGAITGRDLALAGQYST